MRMALGNDTSRTRGFSYPYPRVGKWRAPEPAGKTSQVHEYLQVFCAGIRVLTGFTAKNLRRYSWEKRRRVPVVQVLVPASLLAGTLHGYTGLVKLVSFPRWHTRQCPRAAYTHTEYRIPSSRGPTPLVCEVLRVRGRLDTGVVVTARAPPHAGRVVVTVALLVE